VVDVQIDAGAFVVWVADDLSTWTDGAELPGGSLPGTPARRRQRHAGHHRHARGSGCSVQRRWHHLEEVSNFVQPHRLARATAAATDGSTVIIVGGTDEADAQFVWLGTPIDE
jgi:hypothetical protein